MLIIAEVMKNYLFLTALLFVAATGCKKDKNDEPAPSVKYFGTWQLKSSSQISARMGHTAAAVGDKGYVGLGNEYSTTVNYLHDWWEYNPLTDSWTQKAAFPGNSDGTQMAFGTLTNAYVIDSVHIYQFNPLNNLWTQLSNFPGPARNNYFLLGTDSGAYLGMGLSDDITNFPFNDWWRYDAVNDQWAQLAGFPGDGLNNPKGFIIGNKIYMGMGSFMQGGTSTREFKLWEYSIENDDWKMNCQIPDICSNGFGFALKGKGYFVGGILPVIDKSLNEFNPVTKVWNAYYDIKFSGGAFFIVNDKLYLFQNFDKYIGDPTTRDEKFWELTP